MRFKIENGIRKKYSPEPVVVAIPDGVTTIARDAFFGWGIAGQVAAILMPRVFFEIHTKKNTCAKNG